MKEKFDPDVEAEHLRRIMTSRDVAMRDAWSVLKQESVQPYVAPESDPWVKNINPQTQFLINRQNRETQRAIAQEQRRKREDEKALRDLQRRMTEPRTGPPAGNA